MKQIAKLFLGMAVAIVFFVFAVIGEGLVRRSRTAALFIAGSPIEGAEISGAYMPDFLWVGRAWWIDIDTTKPLLLTLDQWTGQIPVGVLRVYSNHDDTNTVKYGDSGFWDFPESISVRELKP